MQCLILAGGLGTRMRPRTESVPKMLLPVAGHPFAHWQLSWLAGQGIRRIVLSTGYLSGELIRYVGDGSAWGIEASVVDEGTELLGTGGAVRHAVDCDVMDEEFMILYGDSYLSIDIGDMAASFRASRYPAMMAVYHNFDRFDRSNVVFDAGQVLEYRKGRQPADGMEWIDYGLSMVERSAVVDRIPSGSSDLGVFFATLSLQGSLGGYPAQERFYEIGSPEGLSDLEALLSSSG